MEDALTAFLGKPLKDSGVGDLTVASLKSLESAWKRARGQETRKEVGLEGMVVSFFEQAAILLSRCLDRGFLEVEEAEAGVDGETPEGERVRRALAAVVLLTTACRSVDDDVAGASDTFVMAGGDAVVTRACVPDSLRHILELTVEAKAALRDRRPSPEERARLCAHVVRAGASPGTVDAEPVAVSLLTAAKALAAQLKDIYDSNMDDVFVAVVEDRWGHFDSDEAATRLADHLLPARRVGAGARRVP